MSDAGALERKLFELLSDFHNGGAYLCARWKDGGETTQLDGEFYLDRVSAALLDWFRVGCPKEAGDE